MGLDALYLTNNGVITADQTEQLTVNSAGTTSDNFNNNTLRASNGGRLFIYDSGIDNTGVNGVDGVIEAVGSSQSGVRSEVRLQAATIKGGLLRTEGSGVITGINTENVFENVTIDGHMELGNWNVFQGETIVNNGAIELNNTHFSHLRINSPVTFTGGGEVVLANENSITSHVNGANNTLVNDVDHTIRGTGNIGLDNLGLLNKGEIISDSDSALFNGLIIDVSGIGFQNEGTLHAKTNKIHIDPGQFGNLFTTSGTVTIDSPRTLRRWGSYDQTGGTTTVNGTLAIIGGNNLNLTGGVFEGSGTITNDWGTNGKLLNTGGTVNPGNPVGTLTIASNSKYEQGAGGTLEVEIAGTGAGQFDQLNVSGTATLGGTLKVKLLNGFMPEDIDTFRVLTASSISGTFSTLEVVGGPSCSFEVVYGPTPGPFAWVDVKIEAEEPTALCQNIQVELDQSGVHTLTAAEIEQIDNGSFDNCGIASITVAPSTFTCADLGGNTVTVTVTDTAGNIDQCNAQVTVVDTIDPNVTCKPYTAQLSPAGSVTIGPAAVFLSGSDNCGTINLESVVPSTFNCTHVGAPQPVTLTVNDGHGNTDTCIAMVTVQDVTAPVVTVPGNMTVQCTGPGGTQVNFTVSAVDACSGPITPDCSVPSGSSFPLGTTLVTCTASDGTFTGEASFSVTIEDTVGPVVTAPDDITLSCAGPNGMPVTFTINPATDTCDGQSYPVTCTIAGNITVESGDTFPLGETVVTCTATDAAGNPGSDTFTVTVGQDTTAPVITSCGNSAALFEGIGDLPGGQPVSLPHGVSSDGTTVVGSSTSANGTEAFYWRANTGMIALGDLPGGQFGSASNDVSGDGSVIVGRSSSANGSDEMFRWTSATGMVGLGDLPGGMFLSRGNTISDDGAVLGGSGAAPGCNFPSTVQAIRWSEPTGLNPISITIAGGSITNDLNGDGLVATGTGKLCGQIESQAWRWTSAGVEILPSPLASSSGEGISADGSIIVGYMSSGTDHSEAFLWTAETGFVGLGDLPGGLQFSRAFAISADGSTIAGVDQSSQGPSGQRGVVWEADLQVQYVGDVLESHGVTEPWPSLTSVTGIAKNGNIVTLCGQGHNPSVGFQGWIARYSLVAPDDPGPIVVPAVSNCQAPAPNLTLGVAASDDCTPTEDLIIEQNPPFGTMLGLGDHPLTITVTDVAGNSTECIATVRVEDQSDPVITQCPPDKTANLDVNCQAVVPDFIPNVIASDACDLSLTVTQDPQAGSTVSTSTPVQITVTDDVGNQTVCIAQLIVPADYVGPDNGSWFTPESWCGDALPGDATIVPIEGTVVLVDQPGAVAEEVIIAPGDMEQSGLIVGGFSALASGGEASLTAESIIIEGANAFLSIRELGTVTAGTLIVHSGGTLELTTSSAKLDVGVLVLEEGANLLWEGGEMRVSVSASAAGDLLNVGCLSADAVLTLADGAAIDNGGPVTICALGTIDGNGTITTTLDNGGTVKPGESAGAIDVLGDYVQSAAGKLEMELGGVEPDTQHDQIITSGSAALAGTIEVSIINGFSPQPGDEFVLVDAASVAGCFDTVNLPSIAGISFFLEYGPMAVTLQARKIGDVNNNGIVNIDDLFTVIGNWGACPPPCSSCGPDFDHDSDVDIDDLFNVIANWD